jgi:3-mercaptopyruvate sulfurtransferase SseA
VLNQGEVPATVIFKGREPVEFVGKTVELNHLAASGKTPQGQPISLDFWVDDDRKLIKFTVPAQGVEGYQEGYDRKAPPEAPKPEAPKGDSKNDR